MNNINKKLLKVTRATLDRTEKVMERTSKVPKLSSKTMYTGCKVGIIVGSTLLASGIIGTLFKQEKWPLGAIIAGSLTIGSNLITMKNIKAE